MREAVAQNQIRNALVDEGLFFRANVGQAWTGSECIRLPNGDMLIKQPRPFSTGLPAGFSDLFGQRPTLITPEMVGRTAGLFCGLEIKGPKGRLTQPQRNFINAVNDNGGRAGVARTPDEALAIVRGQK
ncbi:VRR-NUC domain-containing protein [Terasakiella sp.]|uniref:VRR-NUC domain-containing protein n=1 Tax=Terasakiella sp. TaxID=2034861 RepID=UPI003AA9C2E3